MLLSNPSIVELFVHPGHLDRHQPLHLVFSGPPGTGKTTVARLFGGLLKNLGVLTSGQTHEVKRQDLVAGYVGQTAIKTKEAIDKAMGGVLFIDEAYTLANGGVKDFGREAIDTLLPIMENDREKFVVIAAGYESNMNQFLQSNPGLNDRFNQRILFHSNTDEELFLVFNLFCSEKNVKTDKNYKCILLQYFNLLKQRDGESFSNSRAVRKFFNEAIKQQQKRLNSERKENILSNEEISLRKQILILSDIRDAMKVLNNAIHDQIDFNCSTLPNQQTVIPVVPKQEIVLTPPAKPLEVKETPKTSTQLETAINQLLYDYCIIDTNIWMETRKTSLFHGRIGTLKNLYVKENKKLVAHGSTHEELKKFSDSYWDKVEKNKHGANLRITDRENCASRGFSMLKHFYKEKSIKIPGLKSIHDLDAYADKDIFDFASAEFQKGKSILFITNDNDCGMRVNSSLDDLKSNNPSLPNFDVLDMEQISKSVDLIYENLFKIPRNVTE